MVDAESTHEAQGLHRSFADRPLDGDERDRLLAFRAATTDNAALHIAVLAALVEASKAYRLQLRTAEIRTRLEHTEHPEVDERTVRSSLDQLREWRCVDWVQDPSIRARSIEEYLKRHELWELTPIGAATFEAVQDVLGASDESGSLQRTMFRQVRTSLDHLTEAVLAADPAGVYLQLRELDLALAQLAANAREFYATINRISREERLEDHVFLLYKDQLIAYLQSFHDDLVRNRTLIAGRLSELDGNHRGRLLELADEGDDSAGLFGSGSHWEQRWDGMLDWFVPGRAAHSDVDALAGATTVAIRELLTLLRRLTEQATRPVNRASELRETAAWFSRCESDTEAHALFDAAFGLSPVDHVGLAVADAEADGRFASWWDVDPVDVPLSLRIHGRRPARGSTAKRRDYSAAKAIIEYERAEESANLTKAERRLVSLDLSHARIGANEWPTLLGLLDQALATRGAGPAFSATVRTAETVVQLASADHDTELLAPAGTLVLRGCRMEVHAA